MQGFHRLLVTIPLASAILIGVEAAPSQKAPDIPGERFYLVLEATGRNVRAGVAVQQQAGFAEHVKYVTKLSTDGSLVLGGPFTPDGAAAPPLGVMLILKAPSAEAARRLAEMDPAVKAGLSRILEVRHLLVATGAWIPGRATPPGA